MITVKDIKDSFKRAYEKSTNFERNTYKSAAFVEVIGNMFAKKFSQMKVLNQKVAKHGKGKISGEWLFDIVVCKTREVNEKGVLKDYNHSLEWVVESEYKNTLNETLKDFSKLLVVKSENLLFLNGYSSLDKKSYDANVSKRLNTVSSIMKNHQDINNLYYCFWPSPEKKGEMNSFWENDFEDLLKIIKLFKYNKQTSLFNEIND